MTFRVQDPFGRQGPFDHVDQWDNVAVLSCLISKLYFTDCEI